MIDAPALVLFSGGQDSTTSLAWALRTFTRVDMVSFNYGQRHSIELVQASEVLAAMRRLPLGQRLGGHRVLDIEVLAALGGSALVSDEPIVEGQGLPNTFVPGRNLLFLTVAAAVAYGRGTRHLVLGVCQTDYSGYPDCRDDTIKAMQLALNLGMASSFVVHTPLMWLTKADTWHLAKELGGPELVAIIREYTHTCYLGNRDEHEWGHGCGTCPACKLRAAGYQKYVKG